MSGFTVAVTGLGMWLPGYPSATAWAERVPVPADEPQKPTGHALDRVNRRRASQMGRAIADAVAEAMAAAEVDPAVTPVVVGSSIGEAGAMLGLLDKMWREQEPMSPAVFTVSVHNAASGLLSISMKNRGFTTSIAADYDTPAAVLQEAIGLIATDHETVVAVCADEASPRKLLPEDDNWDMLAAAIVLTRKQGVRARSQLTMRDIGASDSGSEAIDSADFDPGLSLNPQIGFADLVDAIQRGRSGTLRLDRGGGRGYRLDLQAEQ